MCVAEQSERATAAGRGWVWQRAGKRVCMFVCAAENRDGSGRGTKIEQNKDSGQNCDTCEKCNKNLNLEVHR